MPNKSNNKFYRKQKGARLKKVANTQHVEYSRDGNNQIKLERVTTKCLQC